MTTRFLRMATFPILLLLLATTAAGCSGNGSSGVAVTLNASGATFPLPFYEEVIQAFSEVDSTVTVNYAAGGSGKGRQDLADQVVDFAGSDGLVKEADVASFKGGEFLYFPTVAAPITVSYNLPSVKTLKLSPETIAKIFQRQVKRWNDPSIQADNEGTFLPAANIVVAHRSDGSGTTENFTKFLSKAAPNWILGSGSTVEWPTDSQGGNGNQGVSQIVKTTEGAIGYVDLSDAKASSLQVAQVRNKAKLYVEPTLAGASAALDGAQVNPDLSYDPLWADGPDVYPITAPTWILVYKDQTDPATAKALKAFLRFILNDGQELAARIDYARLPQSLRDKALAAVDQISEG